MKALKTLCVLAIVLIGLVAVSGIANADSVPVCGDAESVPVCIEEVKLNGNALDDDEDRGEILRGDKLEVEVKLVANEADEDVVVEVSIEGLDHDTDKATERTDAFTIKEGKTYYKTLNIELPFRSDVDNYAIRVEVSDRTHDEVVYNAEFGVDQAKNQLTIKDVVLSPEGEVKAGRALLATVRVMNMGEDTEEDVKIKVSVPELGISASDYVDELESEDTVTSEELYLRIPECAKAGSYAGKAVVEFDDGDKSISKDFQVVVVASDSCNLGSVEKTIIAVSTEPQEITVGASGAVFPLTISNTGSSAKTYVLGTEASDWADVKISPNVAVLAAGETKVFYVYVSTKEGASAGEKSVALTVKSGEETLKTITLKANVVEPKSTGWDKVKKGLEVALVVLVVLLVVIGLIIGFNKLKGDEDEDSKEETYY